MKFERRGWISQFPFYVIGCMQEILFEWSNQNDCVSVSVMGGGRFIRICEWRWMLDYAILGAVDPSADVAAKPLDQTFTADMYQRKKMVK